MRRIGQKSANPLWGWAAGIGLVVFLFIQVFPLLWNRDAGNALSRGAAEQAAVKIAAERFGIAGEPTGLDLTHLSDSDTVGYFSKYGLLDEYKKEWSDRHPTDVYRADLRYGEERLTLYLQMETGQLVGWQDSRAAASAAANEDPKSGAERALAYAAFWGEKPGDWEWNGEPADVSGTYTFLSRKAGLSDARLALKVAAPSGFNAASSAVPPWRDGKVSYEIRIPQSFTDYMAGQTKLAVKLNALGFVVPQLVLLIMAIIYSASRREYTTFRRGIGLAVAFLAMYTSFYLNMQPAFRAGLLQEGQNADSSAIHAILITNFIVLAGMALFTYLSAVGGDGLWRSMGKPLWPRWREPGFGQAVMSGMKTGYPLAFLLLGVQSVILVGLENGIGMFQASDASQSSYNMTFPWLLLLLAWCAGISEELQSRLFGIGLFRSWLLGGARRLLGREPSPRASTVLTAVAMFPPGLFWAFGHVGYAVYPAYSRLIELIIMAFLFGWFLLRFGFLAVLFAHIVLDSVLMGVQLAFDGLPGDAAASMIGFILPAAVAYAVFRVHRRWNKSG
ncbi:type II CAAX prenyl endopeptidase Rce1 family protein [Cohnella candidum]|uniref:CPBP family intramembrane metalloprotease n=1 Tax=Cohnella candidum TaxID=2674991 RepID=A0A3G3JT50_9BACL|nr:CPBP family intramembrane glutamic endopeptidase [Cohnella candidum]AYQ71398.1 CPBP family intramembrane metalloprotease [Cohnella candidum]